MKIYTSYFGNVKKLKVANVVPICIARGKPRFFSGPQLLNVAPTRYMLSDACSMEEYLRLYRKTCNELDIPDFLKRLEELGQGRDVALCCYEKPSDFCHRQILAEVLNERAGLGIIEFGCQKPVEEVEFAGSLFG